MIAIRRATTYLLCALLASSLAAGCAVLTAPGAPPGTAAAPSSPALRRGPPMGSLPSSVATDAPPSDVVSEWVEALAAKDATTAWALLSYPEHARWRTQDNFTAAVAAGNAPRWGPAARRGGRFEIRMEKTLGRRAVVSGTADRRIRGKLKRQQAFAFVLVREGVGFAGEERWALGSGAASPLIARSDPPEGIATIFGSAHLGLAAEGGAGRRIGRLVVWLDERTVPLIRQAASNGRVTASARIDDVPAGSHQVVVFASDARGGASASAWSFFMPRLSRASKTLSPGQTGSNVAALQDRLASLGFDVPVDSSYGSDTEHAVTAFEKIAGLPPDGVAGLSVTKALIHPPSIKPRTHHQGTWVEIDLGRQVLLLVDRGKVSKIYDIASGRAGWRTSTGSFTIYNHISGWRRSHLGLLWNPYYFSGGQAVHGALFVPPYPASHGCVRVTMSSMARLMRFLYIGMPCDVYGEPPS